MVSRASAVGWQRTPRPQPDDIFHMHATDGAECNPNNTLPGQLRSKDESSSTFCLVYQSVL